MLKKDYLENVRTQYEKFPYPPRTPEDESNRLVEIAIDRLATINFYCFKGKESFEQAKILVAGGGTGDSTIYLAEQLRDKNAEVVYLDISQASMATTKQRAKARNLSNIRWLHGSILSVAEYDIGPFDYISCTGVLHHLDDPLQGLKCLKSVLKPNGAMGLMLYGKYGRTGVYQMQKLMQLINRNETELTDKIDNTRKVIKELPKSNWFCHNQHFINDHTSLGDSGLVDLLLHEQDVSYSIDRVYQLLATAELNLIEFSDVKMRLSYRPEQYINDKNIIAKIKQLEVKQQHHIAELLVGAFKKHEFYVSAQSNTQADFNQLSNIPFFFPENQFNDFGQQLAQAMAKQPQHLIPLKHPTGFEFDVMSDQINYHFFKNIDGKNDLQTIFEKIRFAVKNNELTNANLTNHLYPVYLNFQNLDWLLLKAPGIDKYTDGSQLQASYLSAK